MSTKRKNIASQALLEMESINNATKEVGKDLIKSLLSEVVKERLREAVDEDDEDIEIQDGQEDADVQEPVESEEGVEAPEDEEGAEAPVEPEGEEPEGDSWDNYEQYKVGDDTYDLSGEEDYESVAKVYKLLKDDDQVIIKRDGNKIELKDNDTDAEYVIDLGPIESGESEEDTSGEPSGPEDTEEPVDVEGTDEVPAEGDEETAEPEEPVEGEPVEGEEELQENKKRKKTMKESKNVIFEVDLGYTDNYQDKDPISGLSNTEPSKSGKSWHKGLPTGTEKPWAGKTSGKGDPFEKNLNEEEFDENYELDEEFDECGLAEDDVMPSLDEHDSKVRKRSSVKKRLRDNEQNPYSTKHASKGGKYYNSLEEMKKMQQENKALKEAVVELKNSLKESYLTTLNLGKITKLFLENTTTQAEKVDIINRFCNEAKTPEQSKTLFESINKSLKASKPSTPVMESKSMTVEGSRTINENKSNKSKDLLETIDFMNRVMKY